MTTVPEVIAALDSFERDLAAMSRRVRQMRLDLFETLDNDPDELVD